MIALVGKMPPCIVAMEACCGAHHVSRLLAAHGHDVRLMSPEYVFVSRDRDDAANGGIVWRLASNIG